MRKCLKLVHKLYIGNKMSWIELNAVRGEIGAMEDPFCLRRRGRPDVRWEWWLVRPMPSGKTKLNENIRKYQFHTKTTYKLPIKGDPSDFQIWLQKKSKLIKAKDRPQKKIIGIILLPAGANIICMTWGTLNILLFKTFSDGIHQI